MGACEGGRSSLEPVNSVTVIQVNSQQVRGRIVQRWVPVKVAGPAESQQSNIQQVRGRSCGWVGGKIGGRFSLEPVNSVTVIQVNSQQVRGRIVRRWVPVKVAGPAESQQSYRQQVRGRSCG